MSIYQDHTYKHGVGWSTWHFQWVTKYRHKVFEDVRLQKLCEILLWEAAKRYDLIIEDLEVAVDHIHVLAKLRPSVSPARAIQLLKGYTARLLFMLEPDKLKKFYWRKPGLRSVWGDGKFMASVGYITLDKAKEYIKNHETRHAKSLYLTNANPHPSGLGRFKFNLF